MDAENEIPVLSPPARRFPTLIGTQRTLQVLLGLFWILDAALQYQPYMFTKGFATNFIVANASGQPQPIAWLIANVGHFITPDVAVWNVFFATIQLLIGAGLLFGRTVRPALAISFAWVLGIWFFGEGLGMILTGTASALTGAPGSVLMYGLIGLMAWPRRHGHLDQAAAADPVVGVASSAAGRGIGGSVTPLAVWSGYWVLAAILFVLPNNRTTTSISSAITGMAAGNPSWFSRFLTSLGRDFHSIGTQSAWLLAVASLVIGLGPLVVRRPNAFLFLGGLLSLGLWISGQGWLGGIFTGSGTDPNTGPLVIVLALAMVPTVRAVSAGRSPIAVLANWSPWLTWGGVAAIGAAMALSATYPVAASESSAMAMAGMTMAGGSTAGSSSGSTSSCISGQTGLKISGLDLNNTPYMSMSGSLGMDMNGADATAAAGLNTTKTNWHYNGPPIPESQARVLLADGNNGPADVHMALSGCAKAVTASQQINAVQYVQSTSQAAARYNDPLAALAAGYVAVSPTDYPVVTYVNPAIVAANAAARRTLSPAHIDGLVYAKTISGQEVLAAAMYILPSTVAKAPMPYGALVQWHKRTDTCGPATPSATTPFDVTGVTPCAAGTVPLATPYITMVWQVPVAGGPLAIQPPDIQIVEAAIMGAAATAAS